MDQEAGARPDLFCLLAGPDGGGGLNLRVDLLCRFLFCMPLNLNAPWA